MDIQTKSTTVKDREGEGRWRKVREGAFEEGNSDAPMIASECDLYSIANFPLDEKAKKEKEKKLRKRRKCEASPIWVIFSSFASCLRANFENDSRRIRHSRGFVFPSNSL